MAERELDALVVRAPDNVLYLTNFWGMKGYDACVFPREGEPVLICLEASPRTPRARPGRRTCATCAATTRTTRGRRRRARSTLALEAARPYGRVGIELSLGTQASDRMVGEPTTFTSGWFDAWPGAADATPLLAAARAIKTPQEIERMRLANEICAAAMEHVRGELRPGMKESEAAAIWQGFVHGEGTGWQGQVELALGFSLVWSGAGIKTFTATGDRPVSADEPTLFEIWVCADGYWCDHTKLLCPGELRADYRELEAALLDVYGARSTTAARARASPSSTGSSATGIAEPGYPGQPTHPICHGVGARAHEPPYAHQAGGGEIAEGMVLAIEPGCYWEGGGGLRRRGQLPDHGDRAPRSSRRSPTGW